MFGGATTLLPHPHPARRSSPPPDPPARRARPRHRCAVPRPSPPHGRLCVPSLLSGVLSPRVFMRPVLALAILLGAAPAWAVGIDVAPLSGLKTTEAGGTATFTVVLASQPSADVTIPVTTSNPAEGTVSVSSLTSTTADWDVPQTITVTG